MSGGLEGHSPIDVTKHLKDIDFPTGKQDLLKHAKGQGADGGVLDLIDKMPDGKYENMADVMKGIGKSGYRSQGAATMSGDMRPSAHN